MLVFDGYIMCLILMSLLNAWTIESKAFTFSVLPLISTSGDKKNIPTYEMKSDHENGQIM